jgi:hypothetical protein
MHEEVAGWVSRIVCESVKDWKSEDTDELESHIARFEKSKIAWVHPYALAMNSVVAPLKLSPSPRARSWIAVAAVNVAVLLLIVMRPGRSSVEKWLPFLGFAGTGVCGWTMNGITNLHLDPFLFVGLLVGEVVLLAGAGVLSPRVLRQVAHIEPLNRIVVPLALRLPWSRRRLFRDYVASVRNQLERDKRQANEEQYVPLPAYVRSEGDRESTTLQEPANRVRDILTCLKSPRGHILIEAPGGRGKSALLREIVRLSLERFEQNPGNTPVPVLLTGGGESIEKMIEQSLGSVLLSPDVLPLQFDAGDFFVVLDGISESGPSAEVVNRHLQGPYGSSISLLVSSRPSPTYRRAIEGTARWMVVEPLRLDDELLKKFVRHYRGAELSGPVLAACRGSDGTYLAILVRMAMCVSDAESAQFSVADIYFQYFLRLVTAEYPSDGERLEWLGKAADWCLRTYWTDGLRQRAYDADEVQQTLLKAGVLVSADGRALPREVQFFHDSMQSYLTAFGLSRLDRSDYAQLPRPRGDTTNRTWDRARVILWAAADKKFVQAKADILQTGGTELFQMCLATYLPRSAMRQ